jgi:hypothetical protein
MSRKCMSRKNSFSSGETIVGKIVSRYFQVHVTKIINNPYHILQLRSLGLVGGMF